MNQVLINKLNIKKIDEEIDFFNKIGNNVEDKKERNYNNKLIINKSSRNE